jgi:diguanylate cyclase (GGDEF)-like protein
MAVVAAASGAISTALDPQEVTSWVIAANAFFRFGIYLLVALLVQTGHHSLDEIRGAEARLQEAMRSIHAGFVEFDSTGGIVTLNEGVSVALGVPTLDTDGFWALRDSLLDESGAPLAEDDHPVVDAVIHHRHLSDRVLGVRLGDDALERIQAGDPHQRPGDEGVRWVMVSSVPIEVGGDQHTILTAVDVSNLHAAERRLREAVDAATYRSLHDPLTDLYNRGAFLELVERALARQERSDHLVAVIYLDLDHFKPINDEHGHHAGDQVLVEVARRLRATVRTADTVARIGGDEFLVLCDPVADVAEVERAANRYLAALAEPHDLDAGPRVVCGASAGVAVSRPGDGVDDLIRRADEALYRSKRSGRGRVSA